MVLPRALELEISTLMSERMKEAEAKLAKNPQDVMTGMAPNDLGKAEAL